MAFYENTIVAKQDLAEKDLKIVKDRYNEIISKSSGKVIKIEEWGLLNLATRIKNYKKGFYIHYKFEGNKETLNEISKNTDLDITTVKTLIWENSSSKNFRTPHTIKDKKVWNIVEKEYRNIVNIILRKLYLY